MHLPELNRSIKDYESGLKTAFGAALRHDELDLKHEKMRESAFLFLRATCWRWAEAAAVLCPNLMDAPAVPSVGDAHAGNFGLWRDAQFRLVWGINDYDEAARLPYPLDLVRLCTSIALADKTLALADITSAVLTGYRRALKSPQPTVLERSHSWLRDLFEASDAERAKFWTKLWKLSPETPRPDEFLQVLKAAMPDDLNELRIAARTAGAGSLGRPRFVAYAEYRGGPIAFEIKAQLPSCWAIGREPGLSALIAKGRYRASDPSLNYTHDYVIRRLSPNNRKLDFVDIKRSLQGKLIEAMGAELAAVHADGTDITAIQRSLKALPANWLEEATLTVAAWTVKEWNSYQNMSH